MRLGHTILDLGGERLTIHILHRGQFPMHSKRVFGIALSCGGKKAVTVSYGLTV
jgi:hypothetical protein